MRKVLFITTRKPVANISGGQDRAEMFLSLFEEQKFQIEVICGEEFNSNSELIKNKTFVRKSFVDLFLGFIYLPWFAPFNVRLFWSYSIFKYVKKHSDRYDIVFYNNIRTYYPLPQNVISILDFVDAISLNYKTIKKKGIVKKLYYLEGYLTSKYEQFLLGKVTKSTVVASYDSSFLGNQVKVIPNWIELPNTEMSTVAEDNNRVVIGFMGKMNYQPNVQAVTYFIESILINLDTRFIFKIIGSPIHDSLKKYESNSRIFFTGYVDNLHNEMSSCNIFIAPMLDGAGLQNKVLHYMLFDRLIVSTSIGVRGFGNKIKDSGIIICDNTRSWINLIMKYKVQEKYNYRKFLQENYSKMKVNELFKELLCVR